MQVFRRVQRRRLGGLLAACVLGAQLVGIGAASDVSAAPGGTFTISNATPVVGSTVRLRSVTPCPAGADITILFEQPPGVFQFGERPPINPDGSWSVDEGVGAPTGAARWLVSCFDANEQEVLTYAPVTMTIVAGALPRVSIGDASVVEGNARSRLVKFTVSLARSYRDTVTVRYATAPGTATAGSDFVAKSGVVTIPAGGTSGIVTIPVKGDRNVEPRETFTVHLTNPRNAVRLRSTGTGAIIGDDSPSSSAARLSVGNASLVEGRAGTRALRFAVTLSDALLTGPVTAHYATTPGTATAGDFTATSGTATIPANTTSTTVLVWIKPDTVTEPTELFRLTLSNPTGAALYRFSAAGQISDDD